MKERPILFSAPMVHSNLDGTKIMTRRIVKMSPGTPVHAKDFEYWLKKDYSVFKESFKCPYGQPGDQLWVKETWQYSDWTEDGYPFITYKADGTQLLHETIPEDWSDRLLEIWEKLSAEKNFSIDQRAADRIWRPSIFMPRWASRIQLEIVDIRVERLNDCSEEDARAEGCITELIKSDYDGSMIHVPKEIPDGSGMGMVGWDNCKDWYADLWDSINGHGSWDKNPWVWVIEFKKINK